MIMANITVVADFKEYYLRFSWDFYESLVWRDFKYTEIKYTK